MCSQEHLSSIPIPPVSIFVIDSVAHIVHPSITSIESWSEQRPTSKGKDSVNELLTSLRVSSYQHKVGIIDERSSIRYITSFIAHTFLTPDTPFIVREETTKTILGLKLQRQPASLKDFVENPPSDLITSYGNWNHMLPTKGPYVFQVITHGNPKISTFPTKESILSESIIRKQQVSIQQFYTTVIDVRKEVPCHSSQLCHSTYTAKLKERPNLVYLSNQLNLTKDMPCIVYRPSLQEVQTKSKLYLPNVRSQWKSEEMKLLLHTTAISKENKFTSLPKRGLFVWFLLGWNETGKTSGIVQEILENGNILIQERDSNATLIVPPSAVDNVELLSETNVKIGQNVWGLLHIHPKGFVTLSSSHSSTSKLQEIQSKIATFVTLDENGWQSGLIQINYEVKTPYDRSVATKILNTVSQLRPFLQEKRSIIPISNKVEWFSKSDQKWKSGSIDSYPDLSSYTIKTTKGKETVPWTYVRVPQQSQVNQINVIMERIHAKRSSNPLSSHIQELREKGYTITDIQQNLTEVFSIESSTALSFITETLEMATLDNPGVSVEIPVSTYDRPIMTFTVSGKDKQDVLYAFRVIQVLIQLAKSYEIKSAVSLDVAIDEDDIPSVDDELEDLDDLDGLDLDDIDIDDEIEDLRNQIGGEEDEVIGGESADSTDSKRKTVSMTFSTNLSIFLSSLYERDPALFSWQSRANQKDRYTTICQEDVRHPKLMSNETKIEVDANHPGAYGLSSYADAAGDTKAAQSLRLSEKSCDGVSESVEKGEACVAIYHGSGRDKSWYICPRIYDLLENKPLRLQDLDFETPFTPKGWKKNEWRIDVDGRDITQFGPTYKGRGTVRNLKQSDYNEFSLYIAPMKAKYFYPGFLASSSHPEMLSMPCCFISPNKRLEELYGIQQPKKAGAINYIQGWKKTLGWDPPRLGLIIPALRPYFELNIDTYKTGSVSQNQKGHPLWLRRGIPYSPNPFVSCLANSIDDSMDELQIRKQLLEKINNKYLESLNQGLLYLMLQDPSGRQTPLNHYRNHLLFGTNIEWITILDAYSRLVSNKQVWILFDVETPAKPTMIHTGQASYHESMLQTLHRLQRQNPVEAAKWKVCFAVKDGLSWNPIYRTTSDKKTYFIERGINGNDPQAIYWVDQRVRRVKDIDDIPQRLFEVSKTNTKSPESLLETITKTDGIASKDIRPVYSLLSGIKPKIYIGFYHSSTGLIPFYSQSLSVKLQNQIGTPITWTDVSKQTVYSIDDVISFYTRYGIPSPIKSLVHSRVDDSLSVASTVYGIDIPVKRTSTTQVPTLISTSTEWRQSVMKRQAGQMNISMCKPASIQNTLRLLNELELQKNVKSNRFIPHYFEKADTILQLVLKVLQDGVHTHSITIPVKKQELNDESLLQIRKQVGIRSTTDSRGIIRISKEVGLQTLIDNLHELRLRTSGALNVEPVQYIFGRNQVLGIEDECGTKYMLDPSQYISITATHSKTSSFVLQPLYISKYSSIEITESRQKDDDIIADVFISLFELPYWNTQFKQLSAYATSQSVWKEHTGDIMKMMENVAKEIQKRRNDICSKRIQAYLRTWVAQVGWNEILLEKVKTLQIQSSVSITDFKVNDTELLLDSNDINTFADIHANEIGYTIIPFQTVSIETSGDVSISSLTPRKDYIAPTTDVGVGVGVEVEDTSAIKCGRATAKVISYDHALVEEVERKPLEIHIVEPGELKTIRCLIGTSNIVRAKVIQ